MKKLKTFFRTLWLSLTSPSYYPQILKAKRSFTLKYLLGLFGLGFVFITAILTILLVIPASGPLSRLPDLLLDAYPEDMEIIIEDGQLSTNVDEPVFIPLSDVENFIDKLDDRVLGASTEFLQNFLVIDTQASSEEIYDYQTYVLLTGRNLVILGEDGFEARSLAEIDYMKIDKPSLEEFRQTIDPYLNFIIPIGILLSSFIALMISLFFLVEFAVYLLVFSLGFYGVFRLLKIDLTYKQAYRIGIHMAIWPILILAILVPTGYNPEIPFQRTIIMAVFGVLIVNQFKKLKSET